MTTLRGELKMDNAWSGYDRPMATTHVSSGTVHTLPKDLRAALIDNATGFTAWEDITPLARNEFIC